VFLDDDTSKSLARAETIADVKSTKDLALVSDTLSFAVKDHGIVATVEDRLQEAGVAVYRKISQEQAERGIRVDEPNILVLTGHKDEAFREYVAALHDSGVLRDRVILILSCYAKGDEDFNSAVLSSDKAPKAMVFFPDELDASAVVDFLSVLAEKVKEQSKKSPAKLRAIWDETIDGILADPETPKRLQPEIEKLRKAVMQVSESKVFRAGKVS
jgi:hypothetical protein